jgi:FkbM family methyltransferase
MLKALLEKPYYVFRPSQALRRVRQILSRTPDAEFEEVTLPWGLPLRFRPHEHIGQFVYNNGLYDLCVSEMLYRLAEPGETAVDVGANIGHMSSVLAARVQRNGSVIAFEPHPEIFEELSANVALWRAHPDVGQVILHQVALSDDSGTGHLQVSSHFEANRGTASLEDEGHPSEAPARTYLVPLRRLDAMIEEGERVGVMKMDVEGHELHVLKGASKLLESRRVRDLVFEDYGTPPTPVMELLQSYGYQIFTARERFFGLSVEPAAAKSIAGAGGPPSYLATRDADRAIARLSRSGWAVFGLCRMS